MDNQPTNPPSQEDGDEAPEQNAESDAQALADASGSSGRLPGDDPGQAPLAPETTPERAVAPGRRLALWLPLPAVALLTVPWLVCRFGGFELSDTMVAVCSGVAILGAAFLLTWAAELAQLDISQGLAVAAVALIAVLPEYAVDMYFAWMGAKDPPYCHYAVANMTGGNRLLLGAGWPLLVLLWWVRTRQRDLHLHGERRIEVGFLALATAYAFLLPLKGNLSLYDTAVFLAIFAAYVYRTSTGRHVEPELVGPCKALADLPPWWRRLAVGGMFLYSAFVILLSTKPFAEALLGMGERLGIDEFLLVQWVAPMASEAPEFVVAALFVLRLQPDMALGTLLSSKVNQWTLLVGTLPATFSISAACPSLLPLDGRQMEEVLLTAAQSVFGFVVLAELRLSVLEGALLFGLFAGQLLTPSIYARHLFALAYLLLAFLWVVFDRNHRMGCVTGVTQVLSFRRGRPRD